MNEPTHLYSGGDLGFAIPWSGVLSESAQLLLELESRALPPHAELPEDLVERVVRLLREGSYSGSITSAPSHRRRLRDMLAFWAGVLHLKTEFTVLTPPLRPFSAKPTYEQGLSPEVALRNLLERVPIEETLIEAPSWTGVRLTDCDLINCFVTNGHFRSIRLQGHCSLDQTRFFEGRFDIVEGNGLKAPDLFVQSCQFTQCQFSDAGFRKGIFNDVEFVGCGLPGASFADCYFGDTLDRRDEGLDSDVRLLPRASSFRSCDLRGADFSFSDLSGVLFDGCRLDLADFGRSWLSRTKFSNCSLDGAKLPESAAATLPEKVASKVIRVA